MRINGDGENGDIDPDDGRSTGLEATAQPPDERSRHGSDAQESSPPRLGSRILVTWIELTVVGITGGILGATVGGPPGFVIYLTTTLLTVGIIFYNVNELVKAWLRSGGPGRPPR
ncbi:hypothetical protein [Natronorubrum aibiense]|uniref:hypothetical protein n=1 Tax=Natronorubrum aibiense TaxID=348826 RepID=UPI001D05BA67|nr:hypothetical protein [Natronorubrum aibiense]